MLTGVGKVIVSALGAVYVAEDGGQMQICVIHPSGKVAPIVKLEGGKVSEMNGIAFNPGDSRLDFSSQSGTKGRGANDVSFEVREPLLGI